MVNNTIYLALLGLLPSLIWLVFFLLEDRINPEPKRMIAKVFLAGSVSALFAAVPQLFIKLSIIPLIKIDDFSVAAFVIFALIEELVKFAAVYIVICNEECFDEPIDAMIYMITAALGFAALENILYIAGARSDLIIESISMRFVGATLLHAIASGLIGYFWMRKKIITGIIVATLLHTGFNVLVLHSNSTPIYATSILIFASFFLFDDFDIMKAWKKK
jgi:RsiW-degrading membrane proteinase PrsW (M82 family)